MSVRVRGSAQGRPLLFTVTVHREHRKINRTTGLPPAVEDTRLKKNGRFSSECYQLVKKLEFVMNTENSKS